MPTETKERTKEITIVTRNPTAVQQAFKTSTAKRKIIRAGRRGGKTVGIGILAVDCFLGRCPVCDGLGCDYCNNTGKIPPRRVLYTAPTGEQTDRFWYEVSKALYPLTQTPVYKKDETERYIERIGTENRIKAKTAWNANTMRGDYADLLIYDEFQLTAEDAWEDVGVPMLLDNNGDAVFIYTPPSLKSSGVSKARDPRHASKLFKMAQADRTGRWESFHFTSFDNPHLSQEALTEITQDMSQDSYLKEIMAEDDEAQKNLLVYGCFNELICKKERFAIPKEWMVYSSHDFGSANPAALFAAQNPAGDIFLFAEYAPVVGKSAFQNVQAFRDITEGYAVLARVGGSHQENEIREDYTLQGWPIAEPFINRVNAQVDRVKGKMEKNKIYIFSDLYRTLAQLNSCMWKLDEMGKPTNEIKDEKRYHLLACLRYLCTLFSPETVRVGGYVKPVSNH